LTGHRGGRASRGFPEPDRLEFELFGESLPFRHRTPPGGYCPLFEVSMKVGLAQNVLLFFLYDVPTMQKPKPQDFGLSEAEFSKLQALDQKLEKHLPFVVVTVAVLALVVAFRGKLNWAILFVPLALWPFALIVSQIQI